MQVSGRIVHIGASADNVLNSNAPPQLARELLEARLQSELRHKSPPQIAATEVARDWKLLQRTLSESDSELSAHSTQGDEMLPGNQP
jgi:hypothetical protein